MKESLSRYLAQVYRRDVMGESATPIEMPAVDRETLLDIQAEVARIDRLGLGAHLVNRDFVSYQNRRALMTLLDQVKAQQAITEIRGISYEIKREAIDTETRDAT